MRVRIQVACARAFVLALGIGLWTLPIGPEPAVEAAQPVPTVTLIAVGDIMLSRAVARQIKAHNDINYPFLNVRDYLGQADIVFGNLECPITRGPIIEHGTFFRADPGVEQGLKWAGFNVVSLANNHVPNFGATGVLDTLDYLDRARIAHPGAGKDAAQAAQPVFLEKNGIRLAFLAYNDSDVVPRSYRAAPHHPGTNIMDASELPAAIHSARAAADLVIVSMHSGTEYSSPNPRQISFAHAAIDAGADLIVGHHPHVVQYFERYQGKYIFYSLGNFVFDQTWSQATTRGIMLRAVLSKRGLVAFAQVPTRIEHASQPRIIDDQPTAATAAIAQPPRLPNQ